MANTEAVNLFQPLKLGRIELANRMVMAPLTRNRAAAGNTPAEMTPEERSQAKTARDMAKRFRQTTRLGRRFFR